MADTDPFSKLRDNLFAKNLPTFVTKVNPIEILPYLSCLTQYMKEEIEATQKSQGRSSAVQALHSNLIRRPHWWDDLQEALRHPNIDQPYLADLLNIPPGAVLSKVKSEKLPLRKRRKNDQIFQNVLSRHNPENSTGAWPRKITGATPVRHLNASVKRILKKLDIETTSNWEEFASCLDFTFEDVQMIETRKGESPTVVLLTMWSTKPEATLEKLMHVLKFQMERLDIVTELEKTTGFKLAENEGTAIADSTLPDENANKQRVTSLKPSCGTTPNMDSSHLIEIQSCRKTRGNREEARKQASMNKQDVQVYSNKSFQYLHKSTKTLPPDGDKSNAYSAMNAESASMVDLKQENCGKTDMENVSKLGDMRNFKTSEGQLVKVVSILRQESKEPGPYVPTTNTNSKIITPSEFDNLTNGIDVSKIEAIQSGLTNRNIGKSERGASLSLPSAGECVLPSLAGLDGEATVNRQESEKIMSEVSARTSDMGAIPKQRKCLLPTADILEEQDSSINSFTNNYSIDFEPLTLNGGDLAAEKIYDVNRFLPVAGILDSTTSEYSGVAVNDEESVTGGTSVDINDFNASSADLATVDTEYGLVQQLNGYVRPMECEHSFLAPNTEMVLLPTSDILKVQGNSIDSRNYSVDSAVTGEKCNDEQLNEINTFSSVAKKQKCCLPSPDILEIYARENESINNYSLNSVTDLSITQDGVNAEHINVNGEHYRSGWKPVEDITIGNGDLHGEVIQQNVDVLSDGKLRDIKKKDDLVPNMEDLFPDEDLLPTLLQIPSEIDKGLMASEDGDGKKADVCDIKNDMTEKIKYMLLKNLVHILTSVVCVTITIMYKYLF